MNKKGKGDVHKYIPWDPIVCPPPPPIDDDDDFPPRRYGKSTATAHLAAAYLYANPGMKLAILGNNSRENQRLEAVIQKDLAYLEERN